MGRVISGLTFGCFKYFIKAQIAMYLVELMVCSSRI